jgi:RHS repeat-associated protein
MLQQDLGNTKSYSQNFAYEKGTRNLSRTWLLRQGATGRDFDKTYSYDDAGNPTSVVDRPTGKPVDVQCYTYDGLRRLKSAWTPAKVDCATAPTVAALGGPAPYWKAWAFDASGNRTKEVVRSSKSTTTSTYTYPAAGAARPHAVTSIASVTGTATKTSSYAYDATGSTTSRTPAGAAAQALTWDAEQRLTMVKQGSSTLGEYLYTADGERLIRRQGGKVTAYLPGGQELTLTTSTGALAAQRYYSFAGNTVATRTGTAGSTVSSLFADTQDTALLSVANVTDVVTQRRTDPYGNVRGSKPAWPGDHLFLDKVLDSTGLTQVGARYYDASIGRFASVDPVLDLKDPAQWAAYSYSENNPVTFDDPTGMWPSWSSIKSKASSAWKSTTSFVRKNQAAIIGFAVSTVVTGGCLALTAGAGSIGCMALGGALGGAASNGWRTKVQKVEPFTLSGFVQETVFGGIGGAIGGAAAKPLAAAVSWVGRGSVAATQRWGAGLASSSRSATAQQSGSLATRLQSLRTSVVQQTRGTTNTRPTPTPAQSAARVCSFAGSTPVLMGDGSHKAIEDVEVGDEVVASDPETGEQEAKEVEEVFVHDDDLVDLQVGDTTIRTTEDHPFWSVTDQMFERADQFAVGELVLTADGQALTFHGLRPVGEGAAYNLAIAEIHTYHVSHAEVLVHNTCQSSGGGDLTRVGRWMSPSEHEATVATGRVQPPWNDPHSYVARPANVSAYLQQAKPGTRYVEFSVPSSTLRQGGDTGWAFMPGPESIFSRLSVNKGNGPLEFPSAVDIKWIASKIGWG